MASFDPKGKTFKQRVETCIQDAKTVHGISIRQDSGRTVDWQQRLHICHMFLYNKYQSTKPANVETGKRTISWAHLSDPKVVWATVPFTDILRTAANAIPQKDGASWKTGMEPQREATEKRAKALLSQAGVGNSGQAMVSAGLKPCGEPCKCGAGRSKHLDGVAADFNTSDMATLKHKLAATKAGSIDDYLKKFGLHRPLANHAESPEPWHIEAIP